MKFLKVLFIITILVSTKIIAQNYGLGNADPSVFSKYRLPEVTMHSLWLGSNFSFSSQKMSAPSDYSSDYYRYNSNLSVTPNYYLLNQTDDQIFSLNLEANGVYSNNYSKSRIVSYSQESLNKQISYSLKMYLDLDYKKYFESTAKYFSLKSVNQVDLYQEQNDNNNNSRLSMTKSQGYSLYAGFGYGKLRNVTSVVTAIRLQERLKLLNVLNNDLSQSTIENLSEFFSMNDFYRKIYNRSGKYFWQGIEDVLKKDGILLSGLNQYGSSYITEVPNEMRFERYEGFNTGINLKLTYSNSYNNYNSEYGYTLILESLFLQGNIYLNYSHQMDLNSQLSFDISMSGGPNLTSDADVKQQYELSAGAGYQYELTDRLVASANYRLNLLFQNADKQSKNLSHDFNLGVRYFMEDQISLNATYELSYFEWRYFYNDRMDFRNGNSINIGLTYYFDRGIMHK